MKNYNSILTEKHKKISIIIKIDKHEFLTDEILPSGQSRIIEQATFPYSPLGKAFEKQAKTIEEQGKNKLKQLKSMENN